jgi:acetyl esterase/lipase
VKACLIVLALLSTAITLVFPVFAADPVRRERKDPAKGDTEKKDDRKDDRHKAAFEVQSVKNLPYRDGKQADPVQHRLDLYYPRGVKGYPVLFFIHGGAWRSGDKDEYDDLGQLFAGEGIGTVIINYRLSPKVQHPSHIEDVASAFAWTRANIEKYDGRKDRIFVCGHSAGGHLAALLATDEKYLKKEGQSLKDIQGVIAISGVHHIVPIIPLYRSVFGNNREDCKEASPLNHVARNDPPFLLLYAEHDLPTLGRMAEEMNLELKKNKCDAECQLMARRNHITIITSLMQEGDESHQAIRDFIARHSEWKPVARSAARDDSRRESRKLSMPRRSER